MAKPAGHKTGVRTSSKRLFVHHHPRSPALSVAALCVCALALSSCAGKKDEPIEHWQDVKPAVTATLDDLRREQARMRIQLERLEERIDHNQQLIAVQRAQIAALSNILDRSRRAKPSEEKKAGKPKPVDSPSRETTQAAKPVPADSEAIKDAYTAAYLSLKSLRFDEATRAFRAFLKQYPNSAYADQAWFWLGESLYNQKKWKEALQAYHIVAADYPHSVKHAAALLKVALLYRHEGKIDEAKALLERLLREHPTSDSAANAKALLLKLEKDTPEQPAS